MAVARRRRRRRRQSAENMMNSHRLRQLGNPLGGTKIIILLSCFKISLISFCVTCPLPGNIITRLERNWVRKLGEHLCGLMYLIRNNLGACSLFTYALYSIHTPTPTRNNNRTTSTANIKMVIRAMRLLSILQLLSLRMPQAFKLNARLLVFFPANNTYIDSRILPLKCCNILTILLAQFFFHWKNPQVFFAEKYQ